MHSLNVAEVLTGAGYQIRGKRASCPHCEGHSKLTVAFTDDGRFFCHRCLKGGHIHALARAQGIALPAPRPRLADIPKREFREWLSRKMTSLAQEERLAYKKLSWARAGLCFYPEHELIWHWLVGFHERRRVWEAFWSRAVDRIGRLELYRAWRRHAR